MLGVSSVSRAQSVSFSGNGMVRQAPRFGQDAESPLPLSIPGSKPPKKKRVGFFEISMRRAMVGLAALTVILGGSYRHREVLMDGVLKGISPVMGGDGSRIFVSSDGNEKVTKAEHELAASVLEVHQRDHQFKAALPQAILQYFGDSPAAKAQSEGMARVLAVHATAISNAERGLNIDAQEARMTPQTIRDRILPSDHPSQIKRRDALLQYADTITRLDLASGGVMSSVYLPAKLKLADELFKTMIHWEQNYDTLFQPASAKAEDVQAHTQGKALFMEWMQDLHRAKAFHDKQHLTQEGLLDGSALKNHKAFTTQDAADFATSLGIQQKIPLEMLAKYDPRSLALSRYTGGVISVYQRIGLTSDAGLARREANVKHIHDNHLLDLGHEEDGLKSYRLLYAFFAGIRNNPAALPPETRDVIAGYEKVVDTHANGRHGVVKDNYTALINAIGGDVARTVFNGHFTNDTWNMTKEATPEATRVGDYWTNIYNILRGKGDSNDQPGTPTHNEREHGLHKLSIPDLAPRTQGV